MSRSSPRICIEPANSGDSVVLFFR